MQRAQLYVCAALVAGGVMVPDVARAATYYVSKTGSDAHSCTQAQAQSGSKLTFASAMSCLRPGDTLLVRAGTYAEALINNVPSGTSWTSKVRIAAYPGEKVWLRPNAGTQRVIGFSRSQQYIEFDGINLDGANVQYDIVKIESWTGGNAHHIRIQNAELVGNTTTLVDKGQAILLTAQIPGTIGGNEFINLTIHHHGRDDFDHGLYIQSGNNLVERCNIYDIPGGAVHIYNGYGIDPANNIVRKNIIHDGRRTGSGQRGWGIITNGSGHKLYNNLIYNIPNSGPGSAGIYVYSGSNVELVNNTVYGSGSYGISIESGVSNTVVRNNISYSNAGGNYRNNGSSTTASNNLWTNPLFANASAGDLRLQAGSPAIDQGMTVPTVTTDLTGAPRPQGSAYDIGAYEFGAVMAGPPAAPTNVRVLMN